MTGAGAAAEVRCSDAGLDALRRLAAAGKPVLFSGAASLARLQAAWDAWMAGLEERARSGGSLADAGLTVSVPVGRLDAVLNPVLASRMTTAPIETIRAAYRLLYGRVGASLAKAAYRRMRIAFNGARWELLKERGAREPALVWDLTGRPEGLEDVAPERGWEEARRMLDKLANYQIDLDAVAASLEEGA